MTTTTAAPTALQSVRYSGDARTLQVLDQLKLPHETVYIDVPHVDAAFSVIRSMQIRGKGLAKLASETGVRVYDRSVLLQWASNIPPSPFSPLPLFLPSWIVPLLVFLPSQQQQQQ